MILLNLASSIICFVISFILFALVVMCEKKGYNNGAKIIKFPAHILGRCSEVFLILTLLYSIHSLLGA